MIYWNVQVLFESVADRPENRPPIQIKPVHSSISYQQATHQKYDRRGRESPSGHGYWALRSLYNKCRHTEIRMPARG